MNYGIAKLSIIPLRGEASHRSELVSQLLFGELYEILRQQGSWLYIKSIYDNYEGWMDENQHSETGGKEFTQMLHSATGVALDLVSNASSSHQSIPVVAGSSLPFFDGMNFKIGREKFVYNGQAIQAEAQNATMFERIAMRYINAPYLWGGRSPLGIDCSGFTQVVYKSIGVKLLRDTYQQASQGTLVNFAEEARPGDLAFFSNDEGRIIHTGILLRDNRIIHSSGKVRIDKFDHQGIYNVDTKKYSHRLKVIKRVF